MIPQYSITYQDTATPYLMQIFSKLNSAWFNNEVGKAVAQKFKSHLYEFNETHPNQLGGKRTNFYKQAADSITIEAKDGGVDVVIRHTGLNQRIYGGTIVPVRSKYLTIPMVPEAYNRSARSFNNLKVKVVRIGGVLKAVALVEVDNYPIFPGRKSRKDGSISRGAKRGGRVIYSLRSSVTQKGDPSVVPSEQEIQEVVDSVVAKITGSADIGNVKVVGL